jgi:hypothetical protein
VLAHHGQFRRLAARILYLADDLRQPDHSEEKQPVVHERDGRKRQSAKRRATASSGRSAA